MVALPLLRQLRLTQYVYDVVRIDARACHASIVYGSLCDPLPATIQMNHLVTLSPAIDNVVQRPPATDIITRLRAPLLQPGLLR